MINFDPDTLGKVVRDAWVRWAQTQPDPKSSWLIPWEDLAEIDREADRQIGLAVANFSREKDRDARRIELAEKKSREELGKDELDEFNRLQQAYFDALEIQYPRNRTNQDKLDELEARLGTQG